MSLPERQVLLATPTETDSEKHQTYPLAPREAGLSLAGCEQTGLFGQSLSKHFPNIGEIITDYLGVGFYTGRILELYIEPDKGGYHHTRGGLDLAGRAIPGFGRLPRLPQDDPWTHFRMDERLDELTLPDMLRGQKIYPKGDKIAAAFWENQLSKVVTRVDQSAEWIDKLETKHDILVVAAQPIILVLATLFGGNVKWDENRYRTFCQRELGPAGLIRFKRYPSGSYHLESWHKGPYFTKETEKVNARQPLLI